MRRVLLLVAVLLLAAASQASAYNWILSILPSDAQGMHSGGEALIGAFEGFTDGIDYDQGEGFGPIPPPPGGTLAYAVSVDTGSHWDIRAPFDGSTEFKTWTLAVYWQGVSALDPVLLTVSLLEASDGPPPPLWFIGAGIFLPVYQPGGPVTFTVPGATGTNPTIVTVTMVPEPAGLLAVGSGLMGITGLMLRRRR